MAQISEGKASAGVITDWRPEDEKFWTESGHRVASRNLWISVPCLLLAFCVCGCCSAPLPSISRK